MENLNNDDKKPEHWLAQIEEIADTFAGNLEIYFKKKLKETYPVLPSGLTQDEENKNAYQAATIMVDRLVGMTVGLYCQVLSTDEEYRKHLIEIINKKFDSAQVFLEEMDKNANNRSE